MFLFNQKKQPSLYKDFGHSEEVEKLLDYIETQYEEMLEKVNKKEIEYFDGLNRISEQVSSEFDLKIIELADLSLEYKFKDNLLFKFFVGAISPSIVELFFHPASKTFKNIFGYFSSISQGEYNSVHHLVPLVTLLGTFYLFYNPNNRINQKQRIIKYASILKHHPINFNHLHQAQLTHEKGTL